MKRISDVNKRRKLRYGQAVLLGVQFRDKRRDYYPFDERGWHWRRNTWQTLWIGTFETRWECVDAALNHLGVED